MQDKSQIKRAKVTLSPTDSEQNYPNVQASTLGKTSNVAVIWPYGMNGQLPVDAELVLLTIDRQDDNKAGIGNTPTVRLQVDAEGEVCFGNPLTGSVTYFRENGDIETICKNDNKVTIDGNQEVTVTGDVTINVSGTANIEAPTVNVGTTATAVNIGTKATLCNDFTNCLFAGSPHAIQQITKV